MSSQTYWIKGSTRNDSFEKYYAIGIEIGRGVSSYVHYCTHRDGPYQYAVKIIQKKDDCNVVADCYLFMNMRHRNLIQFKEVFETNRTIYIVVELAKGGNLFENLLKLESYTERDIAKCIKELLEGLAFLQSNEITHRGIKPENILLDDDFPNGTIKIADYAMSSLFDSQQRHLAVACTPAYCAPEVIMGNRFGCEADIWSVGVLLFVMLTGEEPFGLEPGCKMFKAMLSGENPPMDSPMWPEEISLNARDVVRRMLFVDPDMRITVCEALSHPWITGQAGKEEHLAGTMVKLREYVSRRRARPTNTNITRFEDTSGFRGAATRCNLRIIANGGKRVKSTAYKNPS